VIKKAVKLALTGFVIGMSVGNLIAIITSYVGGGDILVFSDALLRKTGNAAVALAVQTFFSGCLGAISMGSVIFYDIDDWSMTRVVVTHYAVIFLSYLLIGHFLGWLGPLAEILIMALCMAISYFIIWIIMYFKYSIEVNRLNELIEADRKTGIS
jgi:hypothetical protein